MNVRFNPATSREFADTVNANASTEGKAAIRLMLSFCERAEFQMIGDPTEFLKENTARIMREAGGDIVGLFVYEHACDFIRRFWLYGPCVPAWLGRGPARVAA
jgi:hypothetical protein